MVVGREDEAVPMTRTSMVLTDPALPCLPFEQTGGRTRNQTERRSSGVFLLGSDARLRLSSLARSEALAVADLPGGNGGRLGMMLLLLALLTTIELLLSPASSTG